MASKSSINILQEYSITQHRIHPEYIVKDVSPSVHSPRFEVTVHVGKVSCSSQAANKKQAKESCARLALVELGVGKDTPVVPVPKVSSNNLDETDSKDRLVNYNAVGSLNEYTSKNRLPYAEYNDAGNNERGLMIIECKLGEVNGFGLGSNKKIAKQNAAAALLTKLKSSKSTPSVECPSSMKIQRLAGEQVDSTSVSTDAIIDEKPEIKIEEIIDDQKAEKDKKTIPEVVKPAEVVKVAEVSDEKTEKEKDEALMEDFCSKLCQLGLEDNNNINVVVQRTDSKVITYKNDQLNLNIVKITYNLQNTLNELYDYIKDKMQ